jgi:demethylmenaquinone methyltransferase / 2-methoxy-6-polyprenyl-1,4-benzoquinol methylase
MTKFAHDEVVPYKKSKLNKKEQVAQMFDSIAFRYDFLNRFLSGGNDVRWRKKAVSQLQKNNPQTILDIATGTGDLAIMSYKMLKPKKIIGVDISEGMLELGRKKIEQLGLNDIIELQSGDSEKLNFPDNSFDAITVAFGVRNFQDLEKGLSEMLRVLKPGGKLVVLEFSHPKNPIFRVICDFYMNTITPGIGKLFAKNKDAYQYLNKSVKVFPEREQFMNIMESCGFSASYFKPLSLGICCIYCGTKQ